MLPFVLSSQIRPSFQLGIQDQAQLFNLGTKRESVVSPSEKNRIGLGGVNKQSKVSISVQYNRQRQVQLI